MTPPTPPRRSAFSNAAGYTLSEILIILVLVGILSAIAGPRLGIDHFRTDSAMQSVGSTMLLAQRLAVSRQHDVVVAFDEAANQIRVHEDANNNGIVDEGESVRFVGLQEGAVFGRGGALPFRLGSDMFSSTIHFSGVQDGLPSVTFKRNGSASEQGGFYLTSPRAAGSDRYPSATRLVIVERATGRASWYRYGSRWEEGF